ncbi:MAG: hypothetical protein Q8M65_02065 [Rhodoglobus sp.]|nr:hypothetical protein [Rhodoglobus sp.]
MIQRHEKAGLGINRCDVGSLVQVAADAAETQVARIIRSTVLFPNDVVDLMRQKRRNLRKSAVLARILRASHDQFPQLA